MNKALACQGFLRKPYCTAAVAAKAKRPPPITINITPATIIFIPRLIPVPNTFDGD